MNTGFVRYAVATVLTVYGIETFELTANLFGQEQAVATVLTVYGIETRAVRFFNMGIRKLQQYLPFTVLKHEIQEENINLNTNSCNSTYRLRY